MRIFHSLKERLFISLFLFLFTTIILITVIYYKHTVAERENESKKYFIEKADSISLQLDTLISRMDTISGQFLASRTLQKMFVKANSKEYQGKNYFDLNINERKTAQDILWTFNSPKQQIESVNIFSETSYVGLRYAPSVGKVKEVSSLFSWAVEENVKYKVIGPHEDDWVANDKAVVISLVRPFIATNYDFMNVGVIEVQEKYSTIEDICNIAESKEDLVLLVIDEKQDVIYQSRKFSKEQISVLHEEALKNSQDTLFKVKENGNNLMASYSVLNNADWRILLVQPEHNYQQPIKENMFFILVFSIIFTVILFLFLFMLINYITKPILQLAADMNQVSDIDKTPVLHKSSINEIQILQSNFIELMDRMKESANELLLAHETELNLRIMGIQAQINPHFLFNSLTAISAVAAEENGSKVPIMCYQLSELFRYSSSEDGSQVSVKMEIDHMRIYLEFMKWRYEDNFTFEIIEEGDLSDIQIARLSLQPLVENAFTHGFKGTYPPYKIRIQCLVKENRWIFTAADNGIGFTQEMINKISQEILSIDHILLTKKGYGLLKTKNMAILNIYIRLKLQYKEALCLEIQRDTELKGAFVKIVVDYHNQA